MKDIIKSKLFWAVVISYTLFSLTICLIPYIGNRYVLSGNVVTYVLGAIFWLLLITSYVGTIVLFVKNKEIPKLSRVPGVFKFFSNRYAVGIDILLLISIAGLVLCGITKQLQDYIVCVIIACLFWFFHMHAILNSKLFNH